MKASRCILRRRWLCPWVTSSVILWIYIPSVLTSQILTSPAIPVAITTRKESVRFSIRGLISTVFCSVGDWGSQVPMILLVGMARGGKAVLLIYIPSRAGF